MINLPGVQNVVQMASQGMAAQTVEGTSENGAVRIVVGADFKVRGVTISPAVIDPAQPAALEQMVAEATGDAIGKALSTVANQLAAMAGLSDMLGDLMPTCEPKSKQSGR